MVECLKVFGGGGFKQVVNSFFFEVVCAMLSQLDRPLCFCYRF